LGGVLVIVDAQSEGFVDLVIRQPGQNVDALFHTHYARVARVIAGIIHDPARAEELAVEVFLKWQKAKPSEEFTQPWLYRTAAQIGLNELRQEFRRNRREVIFGLFTRSKKTPTPEDTLAAKQEQQKVRLTLAALKPRQAELLLLRSHGLSYGELAATLKLNSSSIGTFISRAEQSFRDEYGKRYGKEQHGKR
jgi:RNA polymerase sigma-70 factor (ECF subfamily)